MENGPYNIPNWRILRYPVLLEDQNAKHAEYGIQEHYRAERFYKNGKVEKAIEAMQFAAEFLKRALANYKFPENPSEYGNCAANLSSAYTYLGDWKSKVSFLKEAQSLIRNFIDDFPKDAPQDLFISGVLHHNLGHALYRQGEIEDNIMDVKDGISCLNKALHIYQNPPDGISWDWAYSNAKEILNRANTILNTK